MSDRPDPEGPGTTLQPSFRPLTAAERRLLRLKIRECETRLRGGMRPLLPGIGLIVLLWLATLIAADEAWPIVTAFWIVAGGAILLWVRHDLRRDRDATREMLRGYESARRRDEAAVLRVEATAHARFEEYEDEGACYAFQIEPDRLVFVVGQEFYPRARFPSHDFSLVYPLDEAGGSVDMWIEKRGEDVPPARTIPAAAKLELDIPQNLETREGRLDGIEEALHGGH